MGQDHSFHGIEGQG